MPNAKDFNPLTDGSMTSLVGVPKSGKSHCARSASKLGKTLALLAVEELGGYAGHDIEYELIVDEEWRPSEKRFVSKAYKKLMEELAKVEKRDDLRVLIVDTGNRALSDPVWINVMAEYGTDDPRSLGGNSRQPYVTYGSRMAELFTRLALLKFRKKMHVIVTWHEDVREFEGLGAPRKEVEGTKTMVRWDLARLPMLRGAIRQDAAGWFDFSFFVEPVVGSNPHRAKLVVVPPDQTRHIAGSRLDIVKELQKMGEVPNDFGKLMEVVGQHYGKRVA